MNRPGMTGERCIGLFLLALAIFNPPLLSAVSKAYFVAGVPVLYVYVFVAWAVLLALLARTAWLDVTSGGDTPPTPPGPGADSGPGREDG